MSAADMAIARQIPTGREMPDGALVDAAEYFAHPDLIELRRRLIAPDAPIEFITPDEGFLGGMGGPFEGPEGLAEGWREWLEPWERFLLRSDEWIDVGDGRILVLAHCIGTLAGSGAEVDTPVAAIYTIANGVCVRIDQYLDQKQARAAAGLD